MRIDGCKIMVLCCFAAVLIFSVQARANDGYILMVQQTPANGGSVTPDLGIHRFGANQSVNVSATPAPGYQFLYWLGDVADPGSNSTTADLNGPKIVIAVFERTEFDFLAEGRESPGSGPARLTPNRQFVNGGGPIMGNRGAPFGGPPGIPPPPIPPKKDFPVPDDPIPEPATILLLGAGGLAVLRMRKK